jgi:hypothetical protein
VANSTLIDNGVNAGLPYQGQAPDLEWRRGRGDVPAAPRWFLVRQQPQPECGAVAAIATAVVAVPADSWS